MIVISNNGQKPRIEKTEIAPCLCAAMGSGGGNITLIMNDIKIAIQDPEGFEQKGRIYDIGGVSPTLGAGHLMSEVKVVLPCLTPDRENKRQNGRRFKENGEPMFTLTAQDKHGVAIRNGTKQGYLEAYPGDGIDLAYPESNTRRGRVQSSSSTIACNGSQGTLTEDFRIRKLTPRECFRLQGWSDDYFDKAQFVNFDSQLYKQAGNGVTVTVITEIARYFKSDNQGNDE